MQPFGVKVQTMMPGGVDTNMTSGGNKTRSELSEGSLWEEQISRNGPEEGKKRNLQPLDKFCRATVGDILDGKTGRTWRGFGASIVWFMAHFPPQAVMDWLAWMGPTASSYQPRSTALTSSG